MTGGLLVFSFEDRNIVLTVDPAHLLGNHNCGSSIIPAPDPGDSKAVPKTLEVAGTASYL